jgi:hypothetical protein
MAVRTGKVISVRWLARAAFALALRALASLRSAPAGAEREEIRA